MLPPPLNKPGSCPDVGIPDQTKSSWQRKGGRIVQCLKSERQSGVGFAKATAPAGWNMCMFHESSFRPYHLAMAAFHPPSINLFYSRSPFNLISKDIFTMSIAKGCGEVVYI
jgi:hypothetical protein